MRTISALSLAGGQGKTTLSLFLCKRLVKSGKKVLAIDADPQASLSFFLGVELTSQSPTLLEVLRGTVEPEDGIYPIAENEEATNLFAIPADRSLAGVSEFLSSSGVGALVLRSRLESVAEVFDYAIVDVQPSRSQIALTAVGATDLAAIPAEATTKGVNSLVDTLDFLERQKKLGAFSGRVLGVVPFRDRWIGAHQSRDSREAVEAMKELASEVKFFASIRESEQFKKAVRTNQTLESLGYPHLEAPFAQIVEALESQP